jgi:hypothetical protein
MKIMNEEGLLIDKLETSDDFNEEEIIKQFD